jgi:hypothetical protein
MQPFTLRWLIPFTLVVLLLPACSDSGSSTLTAPEDPDQPLVLWMYGDSLLWFPNLGQGGAIDLYMDMVEQDLGARVSLRRPPSFDGFPYGFAALLPDYLSSDQGQRDLAGADMILIESPVVELLNAVIVAAGLFERNPADCGGDDDQQCLRDALAGFKDSVETSFALLTETVDPSETLIRAVGCYAPFVTDQTVAGTLAMTTPYWQEAQEFFVETAAEYGIPTAQVFDEFDGPDGTDDPQDRGLIAVDGLHPSEAGALLIAETIHDLGYDFAN